MERRMTEGGIARSLVLFTIPLILSGLLQQLYSWADALIVGNFVGEQALAAIGATTFLSNMFLSIIQGFSVGISILVSHAFGEKNDDGVRRIAGTFSTFFVGISLALTVLGIVVARPFLSLLGTPSDIVDMAASYIMIIYVGLPVMSLYNFYYAALRAIGDSRTPFLAIVISSAMNVALDLLFVAVFHMGLEGAAIATVISQIAMTAFLHVYSPRKHSILKIRIRPSSIDRQTLREGLRLSIPTALQSGVWSIGGMLLQNVMNSFGTQTVAAISTAYRIDSLGLLPTINIGSGISTFVAQNRGAGDLTRARKGLKVGTVLVVLVSLITTTGFVLGGAGLMRMFGVTEGAVAIGSEFLYFCAVFYPIFAIQQSFTGYLQGMGDVRYTAFASLSSLAIRVGLSYALSGVFGHRIIAYSEMICWSYGAVICVLRYFVKFRSGKEVVEKSGVV